MDKDKLTDLAIDALINVYGKTYLQENFYGMCTAYSMLSDGRFMYFAGIKTDDDLPGREADEKGWVVSATIWLDQATGRLLDMEYTLE